MIVTIDISDDGDDGLAVGVAPEMALDGFLLKLPGVEIVVNLAQLESIYKQTRGWFVEGE